MSSPPESVPTARSSTSDRTPLDPIALFDHHLKYIQDSYFSFFQERAKIEDAYIDSLVKLHRKTKTMDTYLDHGVEPSTMRHVWAEFRDELEREAQCRMAFVGALTVDVIEPLASLKETQERTRKRIRDDIKESSTAHQEYIENVLPRLKRNYFKKVQEVEDNRANAFSPSVQIASEPPVAIIQTNSNPNSNIIPTNPQSSRPLSRRASGHHPQPRNRSPSSSNPLQDLAHQGKRQLNQLMTFLDAKGGNIKDPVNASRGDFAIKAVRAKREADEADKEYRKGVHWLETLRIRRIKICEGAFKSLEFFVDETANRMKQLLEKYSAAILATSTTVSHLATHAQAFLPNLVPEKDVSFLTDIKQRYLHQSIPGRTLYTNFYVGVCNDLIFGVSLVDYATSRGLKDGDIPKIVNICIAEVTKRGLHSEGIYRISGRHVTAQELIHNLEKDEKSFQLFPTDDIFVVASLLKQYLREFPESLFKYPLEDRIRHTEEIDEHVQNNFQFLRGKIRRLPAVHQATLRVLVEHLSLIAANCDKNKMDARNLAIIFSSVIFGEDDISKGTDLLSIHSWKDSLMEDLIVHSHVIFDERLSVTIPQAQTAVPSMNPPPTPRSNHNADKDSQNETSSVLSRYISDRPVGSNQDFMPQLPPRPGNSIHPSHRQPTRNRSSDEEDNYLLPPPPPPREPRPRSADMKAGPILDNSTMNCAVVLPHSSPKRNNHSRSANTSSTSSLSPASPSTTTLNNYDEIESPHLLPPPRTQAEEKSDEEC